jgi:hypothetical protein
MTNEYVLMSELPFNNLFNTLVLVTFAFGEYTPHFKKKTLYSSQEKDLFKKNHQEGPAATPAPYRKRDYNGAVEHPALRILRKCENQMSVQVGLCCLQRLMEKPTFFR